MGEFALVFPDENLSQGGANVWVAPLLGTDAGGYLLVIGSDLYRGEKNLFHACRTDQVYFEVHRVPVSEGIAIRS